jgi:DNA-binding NarL/FixJ family response regulator
MSTATILLVEDHAGFATALLQMLSQNPNLHIVSVAESGEAALEYLRQSRVDLVLIDYSLPDMSGIKLVQILQQDYPDLACAMLSGHLSTQYARRALEAGARGYLIKDNPLGILSGLPRILKGEIYVSDELRNLGSNDLLAGFS